MGRGAPQRWGLVMDGSGASLPPSPGMKPSSQKCIQLHGFLQLQLSLHSRTQREENHFHLLPLQGSGEGQFPQNPKSRKGILKDIQDLVKGA